jgi:hypothetical protein
MIYSGAPRGAGCAAHREIGVDRDADHVPIAQQSDQRSLFHLATTPHPRGEVMPQAVVEAAIAASFSLVESRVRGGSPILRHHARTSTLSMLRPQYSDYAMPMQVTGMTGFPHTNAVTTVKNTSVERKTSICESRATQRNADACHITVLTSERKLLYTPRKRGKESSASSRGLSVPSSGQRCRFAGQ